MKMVSRSAWLVLWSIAIAAAWSNVSTAADDEQPFLEFPQATLAAAATKAAAFTWVIRQGSQTHVRYARGPTFEPRTLFSADDRDGQPVTDIALSPDGQFVVFTTGAAFGGEQPYNPASLIAPVGPVMWVASTVDTAVRRVGPGFDPIFAPDGARMLYRHDKDLRIVELSASAVHERVLVPGGAQFDDIKWSPDGRTIAFVQGRGGHAFVGIYRPGEERVHWLVTGPERVASPVWSPDGLHLAYLEFPGREHTRTYDNTESEPLAVKIVDTRTDVSKTLWQTSARAALAQAEDADSALRWMEDGRVVFHSEHDGWSRLYAVAAAGGEPAAITPEKCEVAESERVGPTELFVVHNCADLHTRQASLLDVRTQSWRPVATKDVVVANAYSGNGRFVLFAGGTADTAPLPRVLDVESGKFLLHETPLAYDYRESFQTPAPRIVTLSAEDGVTVPAQLFLPRDKRAHAALIFVHGGPHRQMFPAYHFSEYYARTYSINRRLAALGYVVLSINFRSGVGYGRAFREADNRGWNGASEYRDVLAAARWLAARPDVDARRIGIWGGSYGGLLTAQALARNSDLFAAGVAVHGVYDWSWPSPTPFHLSPSDYFGVSEQTRERAFASSPLAAVDQWRSPVLLFSGDMDMNVDVAETVDLAQKLKARSVDVRTVLVPGEAHGFILHGTWRRLWQEMSAFFEEHLRAQR